MKQNLLYNVISQIIFQVLVIQITNNYSCLMIDALGFRQLFRV